MNEAVQNKIDQIYQLARASMKTAVSNHDVIDYKKDSLSRSIRNAKEASVFLDELNAAIKIANSR